MKKFIIFICILIGLTLGLVNVFNLPTSAQKNVADIAQSPTPSSTREVKLGYPKNISIPKISANAYVEHVGKDVDGRMDIPSDFLNAAWYRLGPKPGEVGNSVIAAHFDNPDGSPSVFFNLNNLQKDDEIITTDDSGNELIFKVTNIELFDADDFPIKSVFGKNEKKRLNLITCAGEFDSFSDNYTKRTVVFSELYSINGEVI